MKKDGIMEKLAVLSRGVTDGPEDMILTAVGAGNGVDYPLAFYASTMLRWVSREDPAVFRDPCEKTANYPLGMPFLAAGKCYSSIKQLCVTDNGQWAKDIYGRDVLCLWERFPCFDSYDYLYENRYHRWFFLCCGGKLTRVYFQDGGKAVRVTEDVADLENRFWSEFQNLGYPV